MAELDKLPIQDRKFYIIKYNEKIQKQNDAMNNVHRNGDINQYAAQSQGVGGK